MSQRLNSKGVPNKITDFYHLAADNERARARDWQNTSKMREEPQLKRTNQAQRAPGLTQWMRLRASRAAVNNGKWFNAPNELFLTADTAWLEGDKIRGKKTESGWGGSKTNRLFKERVNCLANLSRKVLVKIFWKYKCNGIVLSVYSWPCHSWLFK